MLTYGSLFTGIGGFDLGLDKAGMKCLWQVEKDKDCTRILTKHWPGIPKFDDITRVRIDASANVIYDDRHGWTEEELRRSGEALQSGLVTGGCGDSISCHPASNVGHPEEAGSADAAATPDRPNESLLPGRKNRKRPRSKHSGDGNPEGAGAAQGSMPELRGYSDNEGRQDGDPSASSGLQQATGSDVALPEVPSCLAQEASSDKGKEEINGSFRQPIGIGRPDVIVGGFP